ncbi:MAG: hypothetical protein F9K36_11790 [Burkholderiaceae bacterium]|nr:MAG: hypothetical protein F9K36_11790 [Burkholderiaceae bacterium]
MQRHQTVTTVSPTPPLSPILQALQRAVGRPSKRSPKSKAARSADSFCAEGHLQDDALTVSVENLGLLTSPLPPATARALYAASAPARHGQRDKTVLDKRVRDTGELRADTLTLRCTEGACGALQAEVASALGLQQIEARLHNLLVYGPGQFFKPHQDTEKHPGMVATLVLVWPSPHIGGELVVRHGSAQANFASQHLNADTIRWFAFYADCRHEVLPVAEGWRVVLTFDLVLPAENATPRAPVPPALLDALREHFFPATGPALRPWVFLLDHEYTERGLHWPLLKGADRPRVAALRTAAEALGLTVHLALAEVHEQWTATVDGSGRRRGRGDWDDRSDPEPDELIERGVVLNHWIDADDRQLRRDELPVFETDTASFSDTDESFLVNQEYEGYMGNYGETLDYWYRRAALVIQTPVAEEAGRFVSEFDAALADALELARQGRGDELATRLHAANKALDAQRRQRGSALFATYSKLAAALPDADQARGLMKEFDWVELQSADARALARLSARRGEAWTADLVDAWAQPTDHWHRPGWRLDDPPEAGSAAARPPWPQPLAPFLDAGQAAGLSHALIDRLLTRCHEALVAADASLARLTPASRSASLATRLQAMCDLAAALRLSSNVADAMAPLVRHVLAYPLVYPPRQLRPLVQALPAEAPATVQALRDTVLAALRQALATPERRSDDHTVDDTEWVCRCADCYAVIRWAESAQAQALTLPMPEARRRHVQESLSAAAAPLVCTTLRQGSPHKLVICKASGLHDSREALRRKWEAELAAIDSSSRP